MLNQVCRQAALRHGGLSHLRKSLIHTTAVNATFWEREKRAGYTKDYPITKKSIIQGLKELRGEINMWKEEMKEKMESDPILVYRPGETDIVWKFSDATDFDKWIPTADSDHNQGTSKAFFEQSLAGHGVFRGNVTSEMKVDGRIKRAGYCNIKSMRARKSFKREAYLDWSFYNMMVIKARGDGRTYLLNIACEGYYDNTWNDVYHYVLHTRGGPHWQTTTIPFSKFFLASKGRVQDKQFPLPSNKVTSVGISVSSRGGFDGNFNLELDYIGLQFDPDHTEVFAYEMYKQDKYIVNT